jgi:DNA-binding transcriptional LysR family regulator
MTIRNATLRQLKVFETVARRLSFSRAAEKLHLTQPAVSTQIRLLEEHAGLPLFEQLGKRIYLTPAGHEMLNYGRAIIQQ